MQQFGGNLSKALRQPHTHRSPNSPNGQETRITGGLRCQDTGSHENPEKSSSLAQQYFILVEYFIRSSKSSELSNLTAHQTHLPSVDRCALAPCIYKLPKHNGRPEETLQDAEEETVISRPSSPQLMQHAHAYEALSRVVSWSPAKQYGELTLTSFFIRNLISLSNLWFAFQTSQGDFIETATKRSLLHRAQFY